MPSARTIKARNAYIAYERLSFWALVYIVYERLPLSSLNEFYIDHERLPFGALDYYYIVYERFPLLC